MLWWVYSQWNVWIQQNMNVFWKLIFWQGLENSILLSKNFVAFFFITQGNLRKPLKVDLSMYLSKQFCTFLQLGSIFTWNGSYICNVIFRKQFISIKNIFQKFKPSFLSKYGLKVWLYTWCWVTLDHLYSLVEVSDLLAFQLTTAVLKFSVFPSPFEVSVELEGIITISSWSLLRLELGSSMFDTTKLAGELDVVLASLWGTLMKNGNLNNF